MDTRKRWVTNGGRQSGKTVQAEQMERRFLQDYPDAVVIRCTNEGVIVEKPVKGRVLPVKQIEHQKRRNQR